MDLRAISRSLEKELEEELSNEVVPFKDLTLFIYEEEQDGTKYYDCELDFIFTVSRVFSIYIDRAIDAIKKVFSKYGKVVFEPWELWEISLVEDQGECRIYITIFFKVYLYEHRRA